MCIKGSQFVNKCLLGYFGPKAATVDGYERTFGVNHLGHFYLTYLLHDLLMKSAPSRIINLSSNYYVKGKLDFNDLPLVNYDMMDAYSRSKLAIMHFTVEAHRMWSWEAIWTFSVHPGIAKKLSGVCYSV